MEAGMRYAFGMLVAAMLMTAAARPDPPADRLARLDGFRERLAPADRARLDAALPRDADGGIAACDDIQRSRASCEAAAYLPALRKAGLMPRFRAERGR
jgi:hypothetical protein